MCGGCKAEIPGDLDGEKIVVVLVVVEIHRNMKNP